MLYSGSNPFPGMNPYLENPTRWPGVQFILVSHLQRQLTRHLPPGFVSRVQKRGVETVPSTATPQHTAEAAMEALATGTRAPEAATRMYMRHLSLEVRDCRDGIARVVAHIEVVSPTIKEQGRARVAHQQRQAERMNCDVHLLEIDLLRGGKYCLHVPFSIVQECGAWDYLIVLQDVFRPSHDLFWRVALDEPLPRLLLPLAPDVTPVPLDMQTALNDCYDESGLGLDIDYTQEPDPPLSPEQARWSDALLRNAGLRP